MKTRRIPVIFSTLVLFLTSFAALAISDQMYTTFVDRDSGGALDRNSLSLKIDKKDVPVNDLIFVDVSKRTPDVLFHPGGRRSYVLVFDLIFSKPEELLQARKEAVVFIEKLGKEDLISIAGISRMAGLQFLCTLTADPEKIYSGLNAIGRERSPEWTEGPEGYYYSSRFDPESAPVQLLAEDAFLKQVQSFAASEKKKEDARPFFIQALVNLSFYLSTVEGRKNILLFTPGFDTSGIGRSREIEVPELVMQETSEDERLEIQQRESAPDAPSFEVDEVPDFIAGSDSHMYVISNRDNELFRTLTEKTEGKVIPAEKWEEELSRLLDQDSKYYVVGWDGKPEKDFKGLHALRLESSGKELVTQQRITPKPASEYILLEKKLNFSEAIYKNYSKSTSYQFLADFILTDAAAKIPVITQIPPTEILKKDVSELILEFYGCAIDSTGVIQDSYLVPVRLDVKNKKLQERLSGAGLKVWSTLLSKPEPATIRSVIANWKTGEFTTLQTQVEMNNANLTVSYPFFPGLDPGIVWPTPDNAIERRGFQISYPYTIEANLFFPDLDPAIPKGEKERFLYMKIYNKPPASKNPPIRLRLENNSQKTFEIDQFQLSQKPIPLPHNGLELIWDILAMPDVPPGSYQLQVEITDSATGKTILRKTELEIR